ncbi:MAG: cation diffusion facilitator family transporter [Thermoplasmatota archaeon]
MNPPAPLKSSGSAPPDINIHVDHRRPPDRAQAYGRNILIAMLTSSVVLVVEVWASIRTGSLALLADAGHLLVDVSGLILAYAALRFASRPATGRATFGHARAEVLAAAVNGLLLLLVAAGLVWRAAARFQSPLPELDTTLVFQVGILGLVANLVAAWFLHRDASDNINAKGAFLNVVGDAVASIGVLVATGLVFLTGDTRWDTGVSLLVAIIIVWASWGLLRGAIDILLERAPPHLAPAQIKAAVEGLPDVVNVHDLHVWTLTPGHHSLSMHTTITTEAQSRFLEVIEAIEDLLEERFGLDHCTIQVEPEGHDDVSDVYNPVTHQP